MAEGIGFLKQINVGLGDLFTKVIFESENSGVAGWFKKSEKVLIETPKEDNFGTFCLWITQMKVLKDEPSTLSEKKSDSSIYVYRLPSLVAFDVKLFCPKMNQIERLNLIEKINSYFFNNRKIAPFVPQSLKKKTEGIYLKITQSKADFNLLSQEDHVSGGIIFHLEYKALFHTGEPLRIEKQVLERKIGLFT